MIRKIYDFHRKYGKETRNINSKQKCTALLKTNKAC